MTLPVSAVLLGIVALSSQQPAAAASDERALSQVPPQRLAQATDGPVAPASPADPGSVATPPVDSQTVPSGSVGFGQPAQTEAAPVPAPAPPPAAKTVTAPLPQVPRPAGTTRNGSAGVPTLARPGVDPQSPGSASITYGGPQVDVQPVYGGPLRDSGAGIGGTPIYSGAPGTLGSPVNGTANSYYPTLPNGTVVPGQGTLTGRGTSATTFTRQPLGAQPNTRDQTGTFGGTTNGYSAQGVYNGTAVQGGTGFGYGSAYAPSSRPIGGLLSTGVNATGPTRPYIPLDSGPIGRPNSGYGVPNGSRSTHMDGRGIQRID